MKCKTTQAETLFRLLRRRAMTYLELQLTGISTSAWRRLSEEEHKLAPKEKLVRKKDCAGRVAFRVVKARG